ncbi:unconventional myosin-VIIa-like [Acyrthosiphon pisum]|uniref:Myosin motor domain-containing protein n=1 Tax=Acyrthosiphon pisum TaxID=7029 RepID=A0A8R1W9M8_ACYPI|nr:unconventional myosin-VIIa-like [Acyrthosiphon pisum]|eukprot:XP_003244419.1 PREDICTED: unconventional myosin-VIIa-like [Acyrthosiphon pisum]
MLSKYLAAAFTVLRSLGSVKTSSNSESSRIGHFIEVQVTDGALYRIKIHCYFLDQSRVVHPLPNEKNYHIFYQMLAGLSQEERGMQRPLRGSTLQCYGYGEPGAPSLTLTLISWCGLVLQVGGLAAG